MKKLRMLILFMVLVLSISIVSAQTLESYDVTIGGTSQRRGLEQNVEFELTNEHSETITLVSVTIDEESGYNLNYSGDEDGTYLADEKINLDISGVIPLDLPAVDTRGRETKVKVGEYTVEYNISDTTYEVTADIYMQAENKLTFGSKTEITFGSETNDLDNSDKFDDGDGVERGQSVKIEVEIENNFGDDGDCDTESRNCDIEDIEVEIRQDDDLDWDETIDFGRIRPDDEDIKSETLQIDDDVDDDDYEVEMWVTGYDENGARHGEYWTFEVEVEVPRDEVSIEDYDLFPSTISCNKDASLTVTIKNTGSDDQDEVSIFLESSKLDIKQSIYHIELDEGDRTSKTFDLDIPNDIEPGQYFIQIIANVDHSEESDRDAARLVIQECQPYDEDEEDEEDDIFQIIDVPPTSGVIYGTPKQTDFFDSSAYVLLLAVLVFIAILMFVLLLAVLLKK